MRLRLPELRLILLAVAVLALLAIFALAPAAVPLPDQAHAQDSPSAAISLSPSGSVDQGTAITVSMSFDNLASDSDTSTTDYIFRADVVNADACEGGGMGKDRYFYQVDEDTETRAGEISTDCPVGDYTVRVTLSAADNTELDSATAGFTIAEPTPEPTPGPTAEPTPEPGPSGALQLSETSVNYGTPIAVTMTFRNFPDPERQPDRAEFRGDVVGADECEGAGLGHTRYIYPGDADPAVRSGTISALCPPGTYTIAASLVSHEGVRIIDTSASFLINDPTWVPAAEVLVSPGNVPAEAEGAVTLRFRTCSSTPTRRPRTISSAPMWLAPTTARATVSALIAPCPGSTRTPRSPSARSWRTVRPGRRTPSRRASCQRRKSNWPRPAPASPRP